MFAAIGLLHIVHGPFFIVPLQVAMSLSRKQANRKNFPDAGWLCTAEKKARVTWSKTQTQSMLKSSWHAYLRLCGQG